METPQPTLTDMPGDVLRRVALLLPLEDRKHLAAAAPALRQAATGGGWFPEPLQLTITSPLAEGAEAAAAWLSRFSATVHVTIASRKEPAPAAEVLPALQALPPARVAALTGGTFPAEGLTHLTALTSLSGAVDGSWVHLGPLQLLQHLHLQPGGGLAEVDSAPGPMPRLAALTSLDLSGNLIGDECLQLLGTLTGLRRLSLASTRMPALPEGLAALTNLTSLNLSDAIMDLTGQAYGPGSHAGWEHLLPLCKLRHLDVSTVMSPGVPEVVSALTSLTSVAVSPAHNPASLSHLEPLTALLDLHLEELVFEQFPDAITALTSLTRVSLLGVAPAVQGWERLQALPALREVSIRISSFFSRQDLPPEVAALQAAGVAITH